MVPMRPLPEGTIVKILNYPSPDKFWFGTILKIEHYGHLEYDSSYMVVIYQRIAHKEISKNLFSQKFRKRQLVATNPTDPEYIDFINFIKTEDVLES
jgi:hypothetical protein